VFAAVHEREKQSCTEWFALAGLHSSSTHVGVFHDASEDSPNTSYFSTCSIDPGGYGAHGQYGHLEKAWRVLENSTESWDWVVKARNDYVYHPRQTLKPCWLTEIPSNVLLTTDKEPHQCDRWNERGTNPFSDQTFRIPAPYFPVMTSDSMYWGSKAVMRNQLITASLPPNSDDACLDPRLERLKHLDVNVGSRHIESIMADRAYRANILIFTTSFQANKVGGCFLDTPCLFCYDCASHT
jgi:hypothetical protein